MLCESHRFATARRPSRRPPAWTSPHRLAPFLLLALAAVLCGTPAAQAQTITVAKSVAGRVAPADQFTVSLLDGPTTLTSATTTGTAASATTTPWPVVVGTTYTIRDAMAAGSPNALSAYNTSIVCTNTTTGTPVTPTGSSPNWSLTLANTNAYACTITNALPPAAACTLSTAYLVQNSPTQLLAGQFGSGSITFTPVGTPSGFTYNGAGYNPTDNYLYAAAGPPIAGHIVRINRATGAVVDLGAVVPAFPGANAGTFDATGILYAGDSLTTTIHRINVHTLTSTPLVLSAAPQAADYTFGPGGFLWGATGVNAPVGNIVRIDTATGAVNFFPAPAAMPAASFYGAAFTYGNGNIGLGYNPGGLYQLAIANPASANPTFTVVSTDASPASAGNDGTGCIAPPVDMRIVKTGPAIVAATDTVTWSLTVTNDGPGLSSGFVLSDTVPAGYTAITATPGCTVTGNTVSCTGGSLAFGASAVITMTATAPATVQCLTNTASVLGNEAEPPGASANNTSSLQTCTQLAALTATKSDGQTSYTPGGSGTYTITLANPAGPVAALGVGATDNLPAGVTLAAAPSCSVTGTATCGTLTGTTGGSAVTLSGGSIDPGAGNSLVILLPVAFAPDMTASPLVNTANVTAANAPPASASDSDTRASSADVAIQKVGPPTIPGGSTISYTLTLTNNGPSVANGATYSDPVPAAISGVAASCTNATGGAVCAAPTVTGNQVGGSVPTFPPGSSVDIVITGTAPPGPTQTIVNGATIAPPAATTDSNGNNNSASASTTTPVTLLKFEVE